MYEKGRGGLDHSHRVLVINGKQHGKTAVCADIMVSTLKNINFMEIKAVFYC